MITIRYVGSDVLIDSDIFVNFTLLSYQVKHRKNNLLNNFDKLRWNLFSKFSFLKYIMMLI